MKTIKELITVLLLLLPAGASLRAVYCIIKMQADGDQTAVYKRRLINLLVFVAIAEGALGVLIMAAKYFGITM